MANQRGVHLTVGEWTLSMWVVADKQLTQRERSHDRWNSCYRLVSEQAEQHEVSLFII